MRFHIPSVVVVMAVAAGLGAVSVLAERYLSRSILPVGVGGSTPAFGVPAEPCHEEPERVDAHDAEFAERWAKRFKERLEHPETDPCRRAPRAPNPDDDRERTDEEQRRLDEMDRLLAPPLPAD